ncbi:DUF3267 domain-containing protein [Oceanirhabdus sp. W0125-5]|uniref:DUF3267 domain-containing protein n=1 Tax=Oceanirhabdus sp. W0125-5 TaxID=2999116 RepID=UPI0022F2D96F|nr:DUF3267 domain-containing protein [Oceanirhabdus sp. W0125-5]WBW99116.1 DUF3267 domain-containing protein [Oceanirhabdus sp. W0125-5]
MKLIWKGKFDNEEQLSSGNLPDNAIKFKEPETLAKVNLVASLFIIPVIVIIGIAIYIKRKLGGNVGIFDMFNLWGILLAYLMIIPHEFLHAIAFPKDAEVEVWYSVKNMMAFVFSTSPTSKARFIFLSLLPNMIFGFIPLILWIFIPEEFAIISKIVLSFATFSLMMGIGDFLNVFNAATQMPKNSITQLSGLHSYWYMSEDDKVNM